MSQSHVVPTYNGVTAHDDEFSVLASLILQPLVLRPECVTYLDVLPETNITLAGEIACILGLRPAAVNILA